MLIVGGSALILFPAWVPKSGLSAIGEDGAAEMLQLAFLLISAAIYFASASYAGRLKQIFQAFGVGAVCAAIGEYSGPVEELIAPVNLDWVLIPLFVVIAYLFTKNMKAFSRFWGYASRRPAAGFLLTAVILAYVFGEIFGSSKFWEASLGRGYDPRIPKIVETYLELLACYFVFVSTLGFCLPVTKKSPPKELEDGKKS